MILFALLGCGRSEPEPPTVRASGVRVSFGADAVRLEAPVLRLEGAGRPPVVLAGAVHVADPGYYDRVGEVLGGCPRVLREGLAPEEEVPDPQPDLGPLLAQHGLVRQGEALAVGPGWRTVDLSVAEVRSALLAAGASPEQAAEWLDDRDQSALEHLLTRSTGDDRGTALIRLAMLRGLAAAPPMEGPEAELYWEVLIGLRDRNVAAQVVREAGEGREPVCVVYGADHLADIEARLGRAGWGRAEASWLDAIVVPFDALGLGAVQVRQMLGEAGRGGR